MRLIDIKELSKEISLSQKTIRRYMKLGLPSIQAKKRGKLLFDEKAVLDWLNNFKRPVVPSLRKLRRENYGMPNMRSRNNTGVQATGRLYLS